MIGCLVGWMVFGCVGGEFHELTAPRSFQCCSPYLQFKNNKKLILQIQPLAYAYYLGQ